VALAWAWRSACTGPRSTAERPPPAARR
jgi:hypothetical protein